MKLKNNDVRDYAKEKGVRLWQIAEEMKLCDLSFSKRLRHELDIDEKQEIYEIIDKLSWEDRYFEFTIVYSIKNKTAGKVFERSSRRIERR